MYAIDAISDKDATETHTILLKCWFHFHTKRNQNMIPTILQAYFIIMSKILCDARDSPYNWGMVYILFERKVQLSHDQGQLVSLLLNPQVNDLTLLSSFIGQ